ncbi:MAG: HAD family hydrolase [Mycoplasmatales bacterium]|nr:HAD family hydrolase [Mycoplasmatales bacterium]
MKYAIFSDVDGTIYGYNWKVMKETMRDIKLAQKKGIEVILATGNPYLQSMRNLSAKLGINYFIGSNGGVIVDVKKNKFISSKKIDVLEAQEILNMGIKYNIGANWWDENELFISNDVDEKMIDFLKHSILVDKKPIKSDKVHNPINKIEFYGDAKIVDKIESELINKTYNLARMKPNHLEITKPLVSKGDAIVELTNLLGIPLENTMAIGDSANDHSMFKVVAHSYAMGNADSLTQSLADHYTSRYDQNGLGEAIIDFMFRNRLTDNFKNQK